MDQSGLGLRSQEMTEMRQWWDGVPYSAPKFRVGRSPVEEVSGNEAQPNRRSASSERNQRRRRSFDKRGGARSERPTPEVIGTLYAGRFDRWQGIELRLSPGAQVGADVVLELRRRLTLSEKVREKYVADGCSESDCSDALFHFPQRRFSLLLRMPIAHPAEVREARPDERIHRVGRGILLVGNRLPEMTHFVRVSIEMKGNFYFATGAYWEAMRESRGRSPSFRTLREQAHGGVRRRKGKYPLARSVRVFVRGSERALRVVADRREQSDVRAGRQRMRRLVGQNPRGRGF